MPNVISNIISNAIKFTKKGSIQITTRASGDFAIFSVSDTGIGISEEDQRRMFEKFFKANPSAPGTGVGLALVKEVVDGCGGSVELKSKLGEGTTVTVKLPRAR